MTPSPGIEHGPHWWEASALTTAPSMVQIRLPARRIALQKKSLFLVRSLSGCANSLKKKKHLKGLICIKERSQTTVSCFIICHFRYPNICKQDIFSCLAVQIQGVCPESPPIVLGLTGTRVMCSHKILPLIDSNDYLWTISIALPLQP